MFQRKSQQIKLGPKKSNLDKLLWLVENYLPQKKDRDGRKELRLYSLEAFTNKQIQKFVSRGSQSFTPTTKNRKVSFTLGSWALPYLKFLKQIGVAK